MILSLGRTLISSANCDSALSLLCGIKIAPFKCPASHSFCSRTSTMRALPDLRLSLTVFRESLVWVRGSCENAKRAEVNTNKHAAEKSRLSMGLILTMQNEFIPWVAGRSEARIDCHESCSQRGPPSGCRSLHC